MSKVEEIEQAITQLSTEDFEKVAEWICRKREQIRPMVLRDHSAFLNSYGSSDEGLYDDAVTR